MAAEKYTKADWIVEADIQRLESGRFQGVVLVTRDNGGQRCDGDQHVVNTVSVTPEEALDEAKALAHRILSDLNA